LNILVDVGHPKDVNVFKNVLYSLQKKGHNIKIVARDRENTKDILHSLGFSFEVCKFYSKIYQKALGLLLNDFWLYKVSKSFKPDIFISPGSPYSAHVSFIFEKPHLAFSDTEIASIVTKLTLPFTYEIYTSTSFYLDLGPKQKRFDSYYELAYLHPKYFTPKKEVLRKYGLNRDYIILRLSAFDSSHDINTIGFNFKTEKELIEFVKRLEQYAEVIIFSETQKWQTLKNHSLTVAPEDFHDILNFSVLYIGEGATMASEAAVLGIPSIYISNTRRGYLNELEQKYRLVYTTSSRDEALKKAIEILENGSSLKEWKLKRDVMLREKTDVAEFMINSIENFDKK
jgi:uncharacterized protein